MKRKSRISRSGVLALFVVMALVVSACAGEDEPSQSEAETEGSEGSSGDSEELVSIHHAASSAGDAYVVQFTAPQRYGEEFGIDPESETSEFDSHATSAQVLLSGEADVGSGAMTQLLQLITEGQDFKTFCPLQKDSTEFLMGRTEAITDLEQITDPDVRVAVDSPGGLINFIMNLVFRERGLDITVDDLENVAVMEDGGLRLSALAQGDVDVGSVDIFEQADLKEQVGEENITTLSVTAEDADFVSQVYFASTEWLEENAEAAARFCATSLHANRELAADYDEYKEVVDENIEGGVPEEVTRTNWEFAREHQVWPYNVFPDMNEEGVNQIIDVSIESGVLDESAQDLTYEDVVDTEVLEMTMEFLGGEIDPAEVTGE